MAKFLKENWFKLALLVLSVAGFFWFFVRPSNIKEKCLAEGEFDAIAMQESDHNLSDARIRQVYERCLHRWGL